MFSVFLRQVKLLHLERELATKLGLFQTVMKDVPIGCTDFLINNSQEVGAALTRAIVCTKICRHMKIQNGTMPSEQRVM